MADKPITPAVHVLADMLSYQESAVVSRILLKNRGGSVTLFAFGEGEELSEHTTPFDALVIAIDGEAAITVAGETYTVRAGDTITMPATQPHALRALSDFKMLLIMLKG